MRKRRGGVQLLAELPAADLAGLPRNAQVAGRSAAASWAGHCSDMAGLPRNARVAGPCQGGVRLLAALAAACLAGLPRNAQVAEPELLTWPGCHAVRE